MSKKLEPVVEIAEGAPFILFNNGIVSTENVDKFRPFIRTYYDGLQPDISDATATLGFSEDDPSLTKQEFADECDINTIMANFERTGEIYTSQTLVPRYGDFSIVPDYQTAQNLVIEAQASFDSLPSKLRERFHNDPAEFLEFVSDERNVDEMRQLGILEQASVPVSPPVVAEVDEPPLATPSTSS